jgi:hypothetical protein
MVRTAVLHDGSHGGSPRRFARRFSTMVRTAVLHGGSHGGSPRRFAPRFSTIVPTEGHHGCSRGGLFTILPTNVRCDSPTNAGDDGSSRMFAAIVPRDVGPRWAAAMVHLGSQTQTSSAHHVSCRAPFHMDPPSGPPRCRTAWNVPGEPCANHGGEPPCGPAWENLRGHHCGKPPCGPA